MKILLAGIIARYPFGGVTWCSLSYLLGLRALGHDVFYVEDTGECIYDPVQNAMSEDPAYGTQYIHDALAPFGLGETNRLVEMSVVLGSISEEAPDLLVTGPFLDLESDPARDAAGSGKDARSVESVLPREDEH